MTDEEAGDGERQRTKPPKRNRFEVQRGCCIRRLRLRACWFDVSRPSRHKEHLQSYFESQIPGRCCATYLAYPRPHLGVRVPIVHRQLLRIMYGSRLVTLGPEVGTSRPNSDSALLR